MPCRNCSAEEAAGCQCSFAESDCFDIIGEGTDDNPHQVVPKLDEDPDNLMQCSASGQGAFLPPEIKDPPSCGVYRTVFYPIPSGPNIPIPFNGTRWDTDSMHDDATENTKCFINTPGVYDIDGSVKWEGNDQNERRLEIVVNSTLIICSDERPTNQADDFNQPISTQWKFAEGDYVELFVKQNSGSDLDILSEGAVSPELRMTRQAVG